MLQIHSFNISHYIYWILILKKVRKSPNLVILKYFFFTLYKHYIFSNGIKIDQRESYFLYLFVLGGVEKLSFGSIGLDLFRGALLLWADIPKITLTAWMMIVAYFR